jgi:hypothetical protein
MQISYTEFHQNWTINERTMDRNSFTPLSKAWFPQGSFSWNSQLLNILVQTSFVPNFVPIEQKMYKYGKKIHLYLSVNLSLCSSDFHETHISSVALCGNNLHHISPKLVIKYEKYIAQIYFVRRWKWLLLSQFHETHACFTNFCKGLLFWISWNLTNSLVADTRSQE